MKQIILLIGIVGLIISCHYENPGYYTGENYVTMWRSNIGADSGKQVYAPSRINNTVNTLSNPTIYLSSTNPEDTVWFKIQAFGYPSSEPRKVALEQYYVEGISEDGFEAAVSGVNFVPLDDAGLQEYMVVPGDTAIAEIPVVIKRDPNALGKKFHLYVHLVPTEDFDVLPFAHNRGLVTFNNN